MLNWLFTILAKWVLEHVKNGTVDRLGDEIRHQLDAWILPKVRSWKVQFFAHLKAEAAKTNTELDDAVIDFLDALFERILLPDSTGAVSFAMSKLEKPEQSESASALA